MRGEVLLHAALSSSSLPSCLIEASEPALVTLASEETSRALSSHPAAAEGKDVVLAQGLHGGVGCVADIVVPFVLCHLGVRVAMAIVIPAGSVGASIVAVAGVVGPTRDVAKQVDVLGLMIRTVSFNQRSRLFGFVIPRRRESAILPPTSVVLHAYAEGGGTELHRWEAHLRMVQAKLASRAC